MPDFQIPPLSYIPNTTPLLYAGLPNTTPFLYAGLPNTTPLLYAGLPNTTPLLYAGLPNTTPLLYAGLPNTTPLLYAGLKFTTPLLYAGRPKSMAHKVDLAPKFSWISSAEFLRFSLRINMLILKRNGRIIWNTMFNVSRILPSLQARSKDLRSFK